jgi:predicted secreted Zn-dependent protease
MARRLKLASAGSVCLLTACNVGTQSRSTVRSLPAGASVENVVSYYDITGTTSAELQGALLRNGPTINEVAVFALTEWEVSWRLGTTRVRDCRLARPNVRLTVRTVLPRWKSADAAPAALRSQWRSFAVALGVHEAGHRDLGLRAVAAVTDALHSARQQQAPSCSQLVSDADAAAQSVLNRFYEENARYDERTEYGATQGVVWPPLRLRGTSEQ